MRVTKKINKDNINKLKRILQRLKTAQIRVGVFSKESSEILMIASVNEFGCNITVTPKMRAYLHSQGLHLKNSTDTIRIPERSYIRRTVEEKVNKINKLIKLTLDEILTFQLDVETGLNRIGQYLAELTQETLTEVKSPPNHPFTIEQKKGKANPLINTGRLRMSITWEVL